jgi:hypothetical protein
MCRCQIVTRYIQPNLLAVLHRSERNPEPSLNADADLDDFVCLALAMALLIEPMYLRNMHCSGRSGSVAG